MANKFEEVKQVEGKILAVSKVKDLKKDFFGVSFRINDDWYNIGVGKQQIVKLQEFQATAKGKMVSFESKRFGDFWNVNIDTLVISKNDAIISVLEEKVESPIKEVVKKSKLDFIRDYSVLLKTCMKEVDDAVEFNKNYENKRQELTSTLFIGLERRLKEERLL